MNAEPHFSEDVLLADCLGELDKVEHQRVADHVRGCPLCRATLERVQSEFTEISEAVQHDTLIPPARMEQAHADVLARLTPRRRLLPLPSFRWAPAASVFGCALAAGLVWTRYSTVPVEAPRSVQPVRAAETAPRPVETRTTEPAPTIPIGPSAREILAAEIHIRYKLHEAGVCRRENVRIEKDSRGLVVTGTVASADMRSRIVASLSGVGIPSWVRTNLTTAEEASRRKRIAVTSSRTPDVEPQSLPQMRIALQDELDAYFRAHSPAQDITAFTNRVVTLAEDALTEAWALRRLAERFGNEHGLDAPEAALLERMLRDHIQALKQNNAAARTLTGPILESIARPEQQGQEGPTESGWARACLRLFDSVERLHKGFMALFAVDLAATPGNKDVDVRAVLGSFHEIDAALDTLTLRTSRIVH